MAHKSDYRNPMARGRVVKHEEESKTTSMNIYPDLRNHGNKNLGEASTAEKKNRKSLDQERSY